MYVKPSLDNSHPDPGVTFEFVIFTFDITFAVTVFLLVLYIFSCLNSGTITVLFISVTIIFADKVLPSTNVNEVL
ncbi:hypothetical protein D3C87_1585200 [compost metagenome]